MSRLNEKDIERDLLQIEPEARLRLAAKLLASVPLANREDFSDEAALDLADKRARELDTGEKAPLDCDEEMARIRRKFLSTTTG